MNKIVNDLIKQRNGHYMHCVELATAQELDELIHQLTTEFMANYKAEDIHEFFNTLQVYYYAEDENAEDENALYNFSIQKAVKEAIDYNTYD